MGADVQTRVIQRFAVGRLHLDHQVLLAGFAVTVAAGAAGLAAASNPMGLLTAAFGAPSLLFILLPRFRFYS